MNVLFVLYGDLGTNSAVPLMLHARELTRRGHRCAVALPQAAETRSEPFLRAFSYERALADPPAIFGDGRAADVLHAWTPREGVRRFVTSYLAARPSPWLVYLEDNEGWIGRAALAMVGLREEVLLQHSEEVISTWTPEGMPHVLRYEAFIGLADAAVVIQQKIAREVPPWVPCATVWPGTDLEQFAPRPPDGELRRRHGVRDGERVIVYPGGLNDFTRPGLESLCRAVAMINAQGIACRLLRSGPVALDFLDSLPEGAASFITDLGPLPRAELPALLNLADVFVQPGRPDPFEDLRLPGKLPELFASGRPVVLPDTNIASELRDGVDAVLHRTGSPEEIAEKCVVLFRDPARAAAIGAAGRRFAETHFDPAAQAARLEDAYRMTIGAFDAERSRELWRDASPDAPVASRLARKLRLLGTRREGAEGALLSAYASYLDFALERMRGLETAMAVRDRELEPLRRDSGHLVREIEELRRQLAQREHELAAMRGSMSWRITQPIRMALDLLSRRKPS
jgi:glycosyltransferase involved in cell wall biosynthesis